MNDRTALYRFFDPDGLLLYVGITCNPPNRLWQHSIDKDWWDAIAEVTVEWHPSRQVAFAAEKQAIIAEQPKHNIIYNQRPRHLMLPPRPSAPAVKYSFESLRSGDVRTEELYLYPEIHCSSMVDDYYGESGEAQLVEWVSYLRRNCPELDMDAVPIYWSVLPTIETAPFQKLTWSDEGEDFLTIYSWPLGADGKPLNWSTLPVRMDRFPEFATALAWLPSPFQATCPLNTILRARRTWG